MKVAAILLVFALALTAQAAFNDAPQQLVRFQDTQSGAFLSNVNAAPSLEATQDALFLSALYGLGNKINTFQTEQYLQSLRTRDNGYASFAEGSATLEATYNAVISYGYIGQEVPSSNAVVKFVLGLVADDNLFANTAGGRGNIKSTYQAVAVLKALDSVSSLPANVNSGITSALTAALTDASTGKYFAFTGVPAIKSNYYGVFIWDALNDDVVSADEIGQFVVSQQAPNGAFYADLEHTSLSFESSSLAAATLGLLKPHTTSDPLAQVNTYALFDYCRQVSADLTEAAAAHRAVAHTGHFADNFKFIVEYGGVETRGQVILQGTQMRPELVVRSFNGPSHSNLDVSLQYTLAGEAPKTVQMTWDKDVQKYIAFQGIDTSNRIGSITFEYEIVLDVFGVFPPVKFNQNSAKSVGYKINIIPTATHTITGSAINEGETVSAGTEFEFDVKLANKTHSNIKNGDFDVVFSVLDSSYVAIHEEVTSAAGNADVFRFVYSFTESNIPSGDLIFVVAVKDSNGATYSNEAVTYKFTVPMIASDIQISKRQLTLDDDLTVSFVPATYPDMREAVPLSTVNAQSERRKFFLDIATTNGDVVRSPAGVYSNGRYVFDVEIPSSYDSLGAFTLSFRYESATGEEIDLDNYDSENREVFEEPLSFEVTADLDAELLEQPSGSSFHYGNQAVYRFRVKDKLTGSTVGVGTRGGVFLALSHYDEAKGKSYVSTKLPAQRSEDDELVINWLVNPNAVSGKGSLRLVAEGAGGDDIPLLVNGKAFTSEVEIGGDIVENFEVYSTSDFYSSQTAFVVQFDLSCEGTPLRDVKLRALVFYGGEQIHSFPVGVSGDSYVTSWNSVHLKSPSGEYTVQFFREADQQRAAENEENRQKQLRAKQREAELTGEAFNEQKFLASLETVEVEPLFSVSIPHYQVSRGGLPFSSHWLVLVPALLAFLFFDNIKRQYRKGTRQ